MISRACGNPVESIMKKSELEFLKFHCMFIRGLFFAPSTTQSNIKILIFTELS